ncbi:hypothetical protein FHG64_12185 [Antarcticibacterium flavum]|uniref:Uncharacterized protein n=1 Tax=Antarcticibacterium flavum TaxID=2058175 RepID=A0A5B7X5S9_9FLAO|nr:MULTISPECIES: hypothetical protein [Antarcticibacterium]MCM4158334.1 hypothetical protein [Antarcticibacterium sp. W02-3]QCY70098.1 hypothetical protein FHG64_12185 [Antarcticibacterium flavum]
MSNFTPELIIDDLKNLISYSIDNQEQEKQKFENLHCAILEKYFDARDIKINYLAKTIDLKLPMSNSNYTAITFECLDLNNFLQACLKNDKESLHFYQALLNNYNTVVAA